MFTVLSSKSPLQGVQSAREYSSLESQIKGKSLQEVITAKGMEITPTSLITANLILFLASKTIPQKLTSPR